MTEQPHPDRPGKVAVVVLGMHRSGTSSLAGMLDGLGCRGPATPMPGTDANAAGYYESLPVFRLNDAILTALGSRWDDWRPLRPDLHLSPRLAEFHDKARAVVEAEYGDGSLIYLKDPRISLLLPFWQGVLRDAGYRRGVVAEVQVARDHEIHGCHRLPRVHVGAHPRHGVPAGSGRRDRQGLGREVDAGDLPPARGEPEGRPPVARGHVDGGGGRQRRGDLPDHGGRLARPHPAGRRAIALVPLLGIHALTLEPPRTLGGPRQVSPNPRDRTDIARITEPAPTRRRPRPRHPLIGRPRRTLSDQQMISPSTRDRTEVARRTELAPYRTDATHPGSTKPRPPNGERGFEAGHSPERPPSR